MIAYFDFVNGFKDLFTKEENNINRMMVLGELYLHSCVDPQLVMENNKFKDVTNKSEIYYNWFIKKTGSIINIKNNTDFTLNDQPLNNQNIDLTDYVFELRNITALIGYFAKHFDIANTLIVDNFVLSELNQIKNNIKVMSNILKCGYNGVELNNLHKNHFFMYVQTLIESKFKLENINKIYENALKGVTQPNDETLLRDIEVSLKKLYIADLFKSIETQLTARLKSCIEILNKLGQSNE